MNKTIKLAIWGFLLLIAIIILWTSNSLFALLMGSIGLVPFVKYVFEIRKYHNRNVYLALSAAILTVGIMALSIWTFKSDLILDKILMVLAGGLLILSTFKIAFSSTREWNKS